MSIHGMAEIPLRDGNRIPQLGLGTWELTGSACIEAVRTALDLGYRHIDTAVAYGNHSEVGKAISESGVPRHELFVTTKIPLNKQSPAQITQLTGQALKDLGIRYLDLLLIHWPNKHRPFGEPLGAMADLVDKGRVRSIGVSNFNRRILAEADEASRVPLVTNQVEFHPLLFQERLLADCQNRDIRITAYSPLARGKVIADERLADIAAAHDTGPAEVALAWLVSKGIIVIPKASSPDHLRANMAATRLELTPAEMEQIDGFGDQVRLIDGPWKHYPLEA
jgi:diketogulonate reductase-like aldo/keto reductase